MIGSIIKVFTKGSYNDSGGDVYVFLRKKIKDKKMEWYLDHIRDEKESIKDSIMYRNRENMMKIRFLPRRLTILEMGGSKV